MSKRREYVSILIAFAGGCLMTSLAIMSVSRSDRVQALYHWHKVDTYIQHVNNPANAHSTPDGLVAVTDPYDAMPSLAILVSLNELEYMDLVFPNVAPSREVSGYLNTFYREHQSIVFIQWNSESRRVDISGHQPLHLQAWYRPSGADDAKSLIESIEQQFAVEQEPSIP
jgi:hypothetical protein